MKNNIVLILFVCFTYHNIFAQNVPTGEWRKEYTFFPANINGTMLSGDEWFYNHEITTDNAGNKTGYVAVGYTTSPNLFIDETIIDDPGCLDDNQPGVKCDDFETDEIKKGSFWPIIAKVDQEGRLISSQRLGMRGEYVSVIQSADGGFIAVGRTEGTRCFMDNNVTKVMYNPGRDGQMNNSFDQDNGECSPFPRVRGIITKYSSELVKEWNHFYGAPAFQEDISESRPLATKFNDVVETRDGSIIAVGENNFFDNNGYMLKVNSAGHWISDHEVIFTESEPTFNIRAAIYQIESEIEYIYLGGERFIGGSDFPGVKKINFNNSSPFEIWHQSTDVQQCHSNSSTGVALTDMAISNKGNTIRIPIVIDGTGSLCCDNKGKNGTGIIEELDILTGQSIKASPCDMSLPEKIIAFDVRMGISNTKDGGFAVVSSIRTKEPYIPNEEPNELCESEFMAKDYQIVKDVWNTDAYIVKFTAENELEWEKSFDSNSPRQPGHQNTWDYPSLQHDVKLQECLYSITEDEDGQLTISGNSSSNFDDAYMARVCNASLKNVIAGQVQVLIDNEIRTYLGNDDILSRGVNIINNSNVIFKAGNQINIKPLINNANNFNEFNVERGSIFSAKIDNGLYCNPDLEGGFFKSAFDTNQDIVLDQDHLLSTKTEIRDLKIYPNPATEVINIEFESIIPRKVAIYDMNGRLVNQVNSEQDNLQLDISRLNSGIYMLSIVEKQSYSRIIKRIVVE